MDKGKHEAIFSLDGNLLRALSSACKRQIHEVNIDENLDEEIQKRSEISVTRRPTIRRIRTARKWSINGRVLLFGLLLPVSEVPSPLQYVIPLALGRRKLFGKKVSLYQASTLQLSVSKVNGFSNCLKVIKKMMHTIHVGGLQ